ncbi:hypothetical protein LCGC14_0692210 [marine sediment metagenome]|uniref:Uncharacterized protein n=1 Tax=marine sediment metagenome TaxID=412755 RepID=A0A0F9T6C7_9ZZZZ
MKRKLVALLLLTSVFITGCTPNDADAEIKELIKDIPLPILYDTSNGEILEFDKYVVTKVYGTKAYDSLTGKDAREYVTKATYEGYFLHDQRKLILQLSVEYEFPKYNLTIDDIRDNTNKLYWSKW